MCDINNRSNFIEKINKWAGIFVDIKTFGAIVTINLIKNYTQIETLRKGLISKVLDDEFDIAGSNYAKIIELAIGEMAW